jgi:hypothetical protein
MVKRTRKEWIALFKKFLVLVNEALESSWQTPDEDFLTISPYLLGFWY